MCSKKMLLEYGIDSERVNLVQQWLFVKICIKVVQLIFYDGQGVGFFCEVLTFCEELLVVKLMVVDGRVFF